MTAGGGIILFFFFHLFNFFLGVYQSVLVFFFQAEMSFSAFFFLHIFFFGIEFEFFGHGGCHTRLLRFFLFSSFIFAAPRHSGVFAEEMSAMP